jgi:vancomycin permeability regulator SanA
MKRMLWKASVVVMTLWIVCAVAICLRGIGMPSGHADLAVIFGNALDDGGAPKPILAARLDAAVACYRAGRCPVLFVSGSIDGPDLNEATAMRAYLLERGVADDAIIVDDQGDNTLATARNATAFMRERGMSRVMLVTQYYHLARAALAFDRAGARTVLGLFPRGFQIRDVYSSWREVPAFAVYYARLALDPQARPVTLRPMLFLRGLLLGASESGREYSKTP